MVFNQLEMAADILGPVGVRSGNQWDAVADHHAEDQTGREGFAPDRQARGVYLDRHAPALDGREQSVYLVEM